MIGLETLLTVGAQLLDKVIPDPEAKAKAQEELTRLAQDGELAKMLEETKRIESETTGVSDRWKADMGSDSWLSKNVRPMTLIYLLSAYLLLAVLDGIGFKVSESYVTLLGQWGMLVMSAYFGGRTLEKILSARSANERKL
jgi:hypothetical protein